MVFIYSFPFQAVRSTHTLEVPLTQSGQMLVSHEVWISTIPIIILQMVILFCFSTLSTCVFWPTKRCEKIREELNALNENSKQFPENKKALRKLTNVNMMVLKHRRKLGSRKGTFKNRKDRNYLLQKDKMKLNRTKHQKGVKLAQALIRRIIIMTWISILKT